MGQEGEDTVPDDSGALPLPHTPPRCAALSCCAALRCAVVVLHNHATLLHPARAACWCLTMKCMLLQLLLLLLLQVT